MKKTLFIFITIITLLSLSLASCQNKENEIPVVKIGHAPHDHHAPLYIAAKNQEYFKEHGGVYLKEIVPKKEYELISDDKLIARLLIDSSTGGKKLVRKLTEEHFDFTFGGVPAMLTFIDQNKPIRIVAPAMSEGAGLVVRNDMPVKNWQEFLAYVRAQDQPVKIGYKIAISAQGMIFEDALQESNIPFSFENNDPTAKVTLINLYGAKNLIPALENNIIDGFVIMQPFLALAEEKSAGKVIALLRDLPPEGKWQGNACCALAANNKYVHSQPVIAETLISLLIRANRFITENPEKSAIQIAEWLDVSPEVEKKSIPTIKYKTEFDEEWDRGIDHWVESMVKAGKLQGKVKKAYQKGELQKTIYDKKIYDKAKGKAQ